MSDTYEEHTIDGMTIVAWTPEGQAAPTELHMDITIPGGVIEIRLESPTQVDNLIEALQQVRDRVWPDYTWPIAGRPA